MKVRELHSLITEIEMRILSLSVALIFSSWMAFASETERDDSALSFSDILGRPVTISFLQPLPGILNLLFEMDDEELIADPSRWTPFSRSDVWVYFVADRSEFFLLPKPLLDSFSDEGDLPEGGLTRYTLDTEGGRRILILVILMERYNVLDESEYYCQISNAIYREIRDFNAVEGRQPFADCENN